MKHSVIFVIALAFSSLSLARAQSREELLSEHRCYVANVGYLSRYKRIDALWLSDAESSWNIERNLKSLFERHTNYLARIKSLSLMTGVLK